ncbi:MAG: electron transport complex subunit RsxC [Candidatus Woesearchaeota archaeon]
MFGKGVLLAEQKLSAASQIIRAPVPKRAIIPLQQHIGVMCEPLVKPGDIVKKYQLIGSAAGLSAPIHSSVSGKVAEVGMHPCAAGTVVLSVVIDVVEPEFVEPESRKSVDNLSVEQLLEIIKESGIVGMGGAAFPTHVKLKPKSPVDTLLINGAECEPFLTADHRLMLEHAEEIVLGILVELKVLGVQKAVVCIEDNKPDAISVMRNAIGDKNSISLAVLKTKYPQGAEKLLINTVLGKKVAHTTLPSDAGVVVSNVGTAKAIHDAVYLCRPLVERVVTVTGDSVEPKNLLVRIGTPIKELLRFCNASEYEKLLVGGPMMGVAQFSDEVPVTKSTTGIVAFKHCVDEPEQHCIRCGSCVEVCPYNLLPTVIAKASSRQNFLAAKLYHAEQCMECGCCAYSCPAKIPLVQHIRLAKLEIAKRK